MKKSKLLVLFLVLCHVCFAQTPCRKLTFILLIDNEVPTASISEVEVLSSDSLNGKKFFLKYKVGNLFVDEKTIDELLKLNVQSDLVLNFNFRSYYPLNSEKKYVCVIPQGWLNEEYVILKIYNKENKISKKKYSFKYNQTYITQILIPGKGTILITNE
jgi:hypothetical protein